MKKASPTSSNSARTIARKLLFTKRRGRLAALFILVAMVATVVVSTTFSAKSPRSSSHAGSSGPSIRNPLSIPAPSAVTPVSASTSASEAKPVKLNVSGAEADAPSLATDHESYATGATITFTGANWTPGEVVTIVINADEDTEGITLRATADDSGSFTITAIMPGPEADNAVRSNAAKNTFRANASADKEDKKVYTAMATGANSGAKAQTHFKGLDADGASDDDDPDLPAFMKGKIDKGEYLRLRAEHINRLRGVERGKPFDPGARGRAIRKMNRQEGRPDDTTSTNTSKNNDILSADNGSVSGAFGDLLNSKSAISNSIWKPIGPAPLSNGQTFGITQAVSGRTVAIAIHPTNPDIAYIGAAQGGVYRTLDGGGTWTPIFDNAQTLAIGSIAISPSQPSTIYVGTGEGNFSADSFFGVGVYRIDNADGPAPTLSGPFNQNALNNDVLSGWGIDKIIVHPTNPNIIFIAVASGAGGVSGSSLNDAGAASTKPRGLFRSTNATTANPIFTRLNVATDNGGNLSSTDIEFEPGNPNIVLTTVRGTSVAGSGGVYRSTNALDPLPIFTRTLATISPTVLNRTEIAINKIGSAVTVFAATADASGTVKRSTDGGVTWSAALANATGFCGGQCNYDMPIAVDPTNPNILYLGGPGDSTPAHIFEKSTDAMTPIPTFSVMQNGLHADEHAIEIDPSNPDTVWTGSDGGIWKSFDGATNWISLNNKGYNATQFVSLAIHPIDPYFTIGGTQDNGTEWQKPNNTWTRADFGDGGFALIDQNAANTTNVTMFHTYFNLVGAGGLVGYARVLNTTDAHDDGWAFFSLGTADTAVSFYAPIALGPGNPNTFYFGSDRLRRSTTSGSSIATVSQAPIAAGIPITAIGISPQNDGVRIVGLANGKVWRTMTGSSTLNDVTGSIPARYIARAVIDPNDQNTAYVTLSGYFGAATPHIYKTINLNSATPTWTGIGNIIPDIPVNAFVVDPANSSNIFAGTDIGVYRSTDGGANWTPFSNGLPRVAVFDMAIQNVERVLRIATHGRGMWDISLDPASIPATLQGTVRDSATSIPINGATVTAGGNSTTTNGSGFYQFTNISPDTLSVTASAAGYNSSTAAVTMSYGTTTTQDLSLSTATTTGCTTDTSQADFLAGIGTNVDTTVSPGDVKLANPPTIDQQNTNLSGSGVGINITTWGGQTFTAAISGPMTKADINLFCSGCTSGPNLTLSVRATSGGLPTGPDIASTTLPGNLSGSSSYFSGTFSSPPILTAGTVYALVVRPVSNPTGVSAIYALTRSATNVYAGGQRVASGDSGATWSAPLTGAQTTDAGFRTYIDTGYTLSGNLVSSAKDSNPIAGSMPTWGTLSWNASTPAGTSIKFQVAGHNNASGTFNFVGPDGTAATFFTTSGSSLAQFNGFRYLKYKVFLSTTNKNVTPTLNDVTICFNNLAATSLAVSSASGTYGGTASLSAQLTSAAGPVSGKTIAFTLNGTGVGSATTDGSGIATLSNASLAGINVGTYPAGVGASFATDSGYLSSNGTNSLTVNKADQTITFAALADKTYGDAPFTVSATGGASANPVTFSASGNCTSSGAGGSTITITGAGLCTVTASQAGDGNFNAAPDVSQSFTVNNANANITVNGYSGIYDGNAHGATGSATGVNGEDLSSLLSFGASFTNVPGGIAHWTFAGNANYAPASGDVSITITMATPSIAWTNPADIVYGTALSSTQLNATASVAGSFIYTPAAGTVLSAGNSQNLHAAFTPADTTNYTAASKDVSINVLKATITITADNKSKTYGDANPPLTYTPSGFVNGDTAATAFSGSPALSTLATPSSNVATYQISAAQGTLASANYSFSFVPGNLTINKAALTVTADNKSKLLGAPNPPFTATYTGFVLSQGPGVLGGTLVFNTPATTGSPAGSYPIIPSGLTSANYNITFANGTLNIGYNICVDFDQSKAHQSGSTIPIKLQICSASGVNQSSASVIVQATYVLRITTITPQAVEDAGNSNPDDNFRFAGGTYIFNLKTTGYPTGTYLLGFVVAGDPTTHTVQFSIK
jgi:hypothetical protein